MNSIFGPNLELVGIGKVGKGNSGNTGKGGKSGTGKQVSLDLFFGRSGFDLHLGLNGPNVGLSVLIDGNSTFDGDTAVFVGEQSRGSGSVGGRSCCCCCCRCCCEWLEQGEIKRFEKCESKVVDKKKKGKTHHFSQ